MGQASYTVVQKPSAPPPKPGGFSLPRALVVAGAVTLVAAALLEFGFSAGLVQTVPGWPGLILAVVLLFYEAAWIYLAAGILLSVLPLMVLFLFGAVGGVLDPTAGRSYMSLMMLIATVVLALPAGIRGFVDKRKGRTRSVRDFLSSRHGAVAAALIVLLLGMGLSGLAAGAKVKEMVSAGGGYDFAVDTSVPLVMREFEFVPVDITVPSGQIVEIKVTNEDNTFHTFTYEMGGKRYNHDVPGKTTTGFLVKFDAAGTIPYWCAPHSSNAPTAEGDEEMRGTIVVT